MTRLRVEADFDAEQWGLARSGAPSALIVWQEDAPGVDAQTPPEVIDALARALLSTGPVAFADGAEREDNAFGALPLGWRPWRRWVLALAEDRRGLRRAFETPDFDWSQGVQCLFALEPEASAKANAILRFAATTLKDRRVLRAFPEGVNAVLQAGVDGEVAGLYAKDAAQLAQYLNAILSSDTTPTRSSER